MRPNRFVVILALALLAAGGTGLWAGKQVEMACKNPKCGLKEEVGFGGGFRFAQVTGWCTTCKKFVYLTWDREPQPQGKASPNPPPKPVANIWNPSTGKTADLYACPDCKGPFLPIAGPEEMKFCPKCGQGGFGYDPKKVLMYD